MMAQTRNSRSEYVKLEQRLILLAWINSLLGYDENSDLLKEISEAGEGFDGNGRSYVYQRLISRGSNVKINPADLLRYDENIREHLKAMNELRPQPITLRYFQYLAVLYTEIFLDAYFNRQSNLIKILNEFVRQLNEARSHIDQAAALFTKEDLRKVAYWMATGSGKTLIMHINYRQFLHYNKTHLDNILLITPKEDLSEQHIMEMNASNIPCRRFDLNNSGLMAINPNTVQVIEITKLVEEKRGGGVSVPVEAFEGNNLIFVDEGHKGSGGEVWRSFRDALGKTGFTFEYSATFGQSLSAARDDNLTQEYGKAILFDYSYRYFHGDGYGKDFHILNLEDVVDEAQTEVLMLGNLLSFYEQQLIFEECGDDLKPYNLDKPLWIFVGSSVNAVYTENKKKRSDVLTIVRFLHHILQNRAGWVEIAIDDLLVGQTGLCYPDGKDIFADKFEYLKNSNINSKSAYLGILEKVLHTQAGSGLHLCDMQGSPGELGLKSGGTDEYFGLIYIGDTSAFKKLIENDDSGITLTDDSITGSLFEDINDPDTNIQILIGAKKFMEGWSSWRVSNMGLLNIGRKEGSEIIQLFGRGVRLRGKDFSLKRSSALDGEHPEHLKPLETLNIFSVRANYMKHFNDYLRKEGIETQGAVELPLAILPNHNFLNKSLVVPRIKSNVSFLDDKAVLLEVDQDIKVSIDMSIKLQTIESDDEEGMTSSIITSGSKEPFPENSLKLIDWEQIYLELLEYKERKGLNNLVIRPDMPEKIVSCRKYGGQEPICSVVASDAVIRPTSFAGTALLYEAVLAVLKNYIDKFYRVKRERWESERMVYKDLDKNDPNFQDYIIKVAKDETSLIESIDKLISDANDIYHRDLTDLPTIFFDRHLYQPLVVERSDKVQSSPSSLNKSERRFVDDLRSYCQQSSKNNSDEIYLLRNLSRGKGIGFFEKRGFYPDFILWVKKPGLQRIIFIEPHGMVHAAVYQHDDKTKLHKSLPRLANKIGARTKITGIELDSFIISATPFDQLKTLYGDGSWDRDKFKEKHILFFEQLPHYDYIDIILS